MRRCSTAGVQLAVEPLGVVGESPVIGSRGGSGSRSPSVCDTSKMCTTRLRNSLRSSRLSTATWSLREMAERRSAPGVPHTSTST